MRNLLSITIFSLLFYSCSKENETIDPDIGHDYSGLYLGNYIIYNVDSIYYDDFNDTVITTNYKIRELVAEAYTDLEGEEAFKINRYRKDHDTLNWVLIDVWNAKLTQRNFQKVEENVRFIKLIFPVSQGAIWNGNSMNNEGEMSYSYESIDNPESIGGNALSLVLTVDQYEDINLIQEQLFEEKYAKGVGMVYKRDLDRVRNNLSSPWRGHDVTMTLESYGN